MMAYLYDKKFLPKKFRFPQSFIDYVSCDPIPYLEPWWFLCKFQKNADFWLNEVKRQYPNRVLIPFAKMEDSDDVACFDGEDKSGNPKVYYVHTFAASGWEDRGYVNNFEEWLKEAEAESELYKLEHNSEG